MKIVSGHLIFITLIVLRVIPDANAQFVPGINPDQTFTLEKVGIGIDNPLSQLHIIDGSGVLRTKDNGDGIVLTSYDHLKSIGLSSSGNGNYGGTGAVGLKLAGGEIKYFFEGAEKMTFKSNGRVGIGTTSPGSKLTVENQTEGSIKMKSIAGSANIIVDAATGSPGRFIFRENGTNKGWLSYESTTGIFRFSDDSHNSLMIIQRSSGNVGIGTISPGAFKLAVNGNIRAKEIKVETGWSDFVFEDDYNLPTLGEVEEFIKANKHLPEIPSAKEVEENGVSLGEMDSKLLQKIEELTLYIIDLHKEIQNLKGENINQKRKN